MAGSLRYAFTSAALALAAFASQAHAQDELGPNAISTSQILGPSTAYPSLVSFAGKDPEGNDYILTCDWKRSKAGPVPAGKYSEISKRSATRAESVQLFRNRTIVTLAQDLRNGASVIGGSLEVFDKSGKSIAARDCDIDTDNDTYKSCKVTTPFWDFAGAAATTHIMKSQCAALVRDSAASGLLRNDLYDRSDAHQWAKTQRKNLRILTK